MRGETTGRSAALERGDCQAGAMLALHSDDDLTRLLLANLYMYGKLDGPARRVLELPAGQCERSARHYLLGVLLARATRTNDARDEFQAASKTGPRRHGSGVGLCAGRIAGGRTCGRPSMRGGMSCESTRIWPMLTRPWRGFTSKRATRRQRIGTRVFPCSGRMAPADGRPTILTPALRSPLRAATEGWSGGRDGS